MKKLLTFIALLGFSLRIFAADGISTVLLSANTVSNLLAGPFLVDNITIIATTTNLTTVKFFDSANTTTTIVQTAYTKFSSYATNYSTVFTNENGIVITNTYNGWYTAPVASGAATNTRPIVYQIVGPGSAVTSKDVHLGLVKGLAAVPDQNCQVVVTYKGNP